MNRKERLMATLQGQTVDRPPVCFYELNGLDQTPAGDDPFHVYSHPFWKPLLDLTINRTDRIVMRKMPFRPPSLPENCQTETFLDDNGNRHTINKLITASGEFRCHSRRDRDIDTIWRLEHWLKNVDDLKRWLTLPESEKHEQPDVSDILAAEATLGDSGIVMIDLADPLCLAAEMFDMQTYLIIAMTETELFHQLLQRFARAIQKQVACIAQMLPGRLWRIYGPEYAAPPYLPPALFREFVVTYDTPLIEIIHRQGGFARIHSHGRLQAVLDDIIATGCMGLDPIEPPPQGDVELDYVRRKYGQHLVLFGNLELVDLENLPTEQFAEKVRQALVQGTQGPGRGFVLMPGASPISRELPALTLRNYEVMVELCEKFSG